MVKRLIVFIKIKCLGLNSQEFEKDIDLFNHRASSSFMPFSLMLAVISRRKISEIRGNNPQIKYPLSIGKTWPREPATSPTRQRGLGLATPRSTRHAITHLISTHTLFSSHHLYFHFLSWNWPSFSRHKAIPPTSTPYLLRS